jgi:hypothetical protein
VVPTRDIHERVPGSELRREEPEPFAFEQTAARDETEVAEDVVLTDGTAVGSVDSCAVRISVVTEGWSSCPKHS